MPSTDEDDRTQSAWVKWLIARVNALAPWSDQPDLWASMDAFSTALLAHFGEALPKPRVDWGDPTTDEAFSRFVRQGLGSHRLARKPEGGFVLAMDDLSALSVRPGMARYGGDAHLDRKGDIHGIRRGTRFVRPGENDWAHTKFLFCSSVLLKVTVVDHLGLTHYAASNTLGLSTRLHLAVDHPLRALLKPFIFRGAAINDHSLRDLLPRGALLHRATGLTAESLAQLYTGMLTQPALVPLPVQLRAQGVHPEQLSPDEVPLLPYSVDAHAFWDVLHSFVADAFDHSAALSASLDPPFRDQTQAWWQALDTGLADTLPALDRPALIAALTGLIFVSTGLHSHVGHVAPYLLHPAFAAGRVWHGATQIDRQNTLQLCTVVAATGIQVPTVNGDFSHLMPDAGARDAAARFRQRLATLSEQIHARNRSGRMPFASFLPDSMPCSVSR